MLNNCVSGRDGFWFTLIKMLTAVGKKLFTSHYFHFCLNLNSLKVTLTHMERFNCSSVQHVLVTAFYCYIIIHLTFPYIIFCQRHLCTDYSVTVKEVPL